MTTDLLDRKPDTKVQNALNKEPEVMSGESSVAGMDAGQSPGDKLRLAREKAGYSCEEVGEALKIPGSYVKAIDHNQFDRLPGLMFARGYIRSYARHVELDPDTLIADFDYFTGQDGTDTPHLSEGRDVEIRRHVSPLISIGGVACVVSLLVVVAFSYYNWDSRSHEDLPLSSGQAVEPALVDETPASAPDLQEQPAIAESTVAESNVVEPETVEPEVGASLNEPDVTDPVMSEDKPRELIPDEAALPEDPVLSEVTGEPVGPQVVALSIDFVEDCWIQVRDMDGKNLFTDVQKAGTSLNLNVPSAIQVRFGNVPGVKSMVFAGESVEVKAPASGRKVASLILDSADAG